LFALKQKQGHKSGREGENYEGIEDESRHKREEKKKLKEKNMPI